MEPVTRFDLDLIARAHQLVMEGHQSIQISDAFKKILQEVSQSIITVT